MEFFCPQCKENITQLVLQEIAKANDFDSEVELRHYCINMEGYQEKGVDIKYQIHQSSWNYF